MQKRGAGQRGFTLIEVMISTGLVSILFLSLLSVLSDYSALFKEAQARTEIMALRRMVIQNLNRNAAWTNTFMAASHTGNSINFEFKCLWDIYPTRTACTSLGPFPLVVFNTRVPANLADATGSIVIDSRVATAGFTRKGERCNTFSATGTTAANKRCPIRLTMTWEILHQGVDRQYYPTGYFPSGYYQASYWPGYAGAGGYWWAGTIGAQVEVLGRFTLNDAEMGDKVNLNNYDFHLIKSVP